MSDLKIQINVINQLRLLRQSTFKDPLAFLDEDVQNAQRAKASEVRISTAYTLQCVKISNNGSVLDDFQKLFTVAESGWDNETVKNENPFGIGFFSNISVSDRIVIQSGNQQVDFNIEEILSTGKLDLHPTELTKAVEGFEITLHNFNFSAISESEIQERVTALGRYVQDLDVFYNNQKIEKKDLTTPSTKSPFVISIKENAYSGWLALAKYFEKGITIYYRGRVVTKLDKWYAEGEIHLENCALNLVAPDRKAIINDAKYKAFVSEITDYLEEIATEAALNGSASQQDEYSDGIQWYADIDKSKDIMKFIMVRCNDVGVKYLRKIITSKNENKKNSSSGVASLFLDENAKVQPESHIDEIISESVVETPSPTKARSESSGGFYNGYRPILQDNEKEAEMGSYIFTNGRPKFWVSDKELHEYENRILICKHYDICLVLATSKFQNKVLESLEQEGKIFHIKTLAERIKVRTSLTETELSLTESRAMQLFEMLSRIVGKPTNAFAIGNLMVSRVLEIPEIGVSEERVEPDITAMHCSEHGKVYVDRSLFRTEILLGSSETLSIRDYKFLLCNLDVLSQELAFVTDFTANEILIKVLKTLGGE